MVWECRYECPGAWCNIELQAALMIVVQVGLEQAIGVTDESVVRSAIGEIPLYLGGEVDCIDGEGSLSASS